MVKNRHPERPLSEIRAIRPDDSDTSVKGVDKRITNLKLVNKDENGDETGGLITPELFIPNSEQLDQINQFTLRKVSAEEVAAFTTYSCNDLVDRDDERFRTASVKGFAELPYPYSPTGKSYMVGHDYSKLAVGRIFGTSTKSVDTPMGKSLFLTNDVYIPRIAANETFLSNMEFGVNWAVSVGVMLGKSFCTVGKEHDWGYWSWFCTEGHDKGAYYDPDSEEEDSWGYPLPVSETAKNAVKCIRDLDDAKDMYELSQVFLGAQYMAEIGKRPGMAAVTKSAKTFPFVGVGTMELPTPKLPEKLRKAVKAHRVKEIDGSFTWTSEEGLVWSFVPGEDGEPRCLGKSSRDMNKVSENQAKRDQFKAKRTEATDELIKSVEGAAALASQLDGIINALDDALDNDDDDTADTLIDQAQDLMEDLFDQLYTEETPLDDDDDDQNKAPQEDYMTKKAVLAAMTKLRLPTAITEKVQAASEEGSTAFEVLLSETAKTISTLQPLADAGDVYLKELRADVIDMYVKSKAEPGAGTKGIDVSHIEKLLDRVGNDPEVMKTLRDEYQAAFQAKFPKPVRRSTVESDHNDPGTPAEVDLEHRIDTKSVKKIHG